MKRDLIDLFFEELASKLDSPVEIILTGAAAGSFLGHVRATMDIDFEIRSLAKKLAPSVERNIEAAVQETSKKMKIAVQYSSDIGRWSQIDMLDYREKAGFYKKFGNLTVKLISPEHLILAKMTRYHAMDILDICKIIGKNNLEEKKLTSLFVRAFKASPVSQKKSEFKKYVADFYKTKGKTLWGKSFNAEATIQSFEDQIR